jgi:hypothetical protein
MFHETLCDSKSTDIARLDIASRSKRFVRESCSHYSLDPQIARHRCLQRLHYGVCIRNVSEASAVRLLQTPGTLPVQKRKPLTAKQTRHCGTVLVMTALH